MTAIAIGSSQTVVLGDGGTVAVATNGGLGSVTVTPAAGTQITVSLGPAPERRVFGPYSEGALVSITNSSAGAMDYDAAPGANAAIQTGAVARSSGPAPVAALGDSLTWYQIQSGFTTNQICYASQGFLTWGMAFSMGALWTPLVVEIGNTTPFVNYNRAVSGETAEQIAARVVELDALPIKPRFCSILAGTNNLTVNPTQTASSIVSAITGLCAQVLARGITPVLCTLLPRGNGTAAGWGSLSAGQIATARGRLLEVNRQLRQYAAATPGVILADLFTALCNFGSTTSDATVAWQPDYLHTNAPGAIRVGQVWWNAVQPYVTPGLDYYMGAGDGWSVSDNPYGSQTTASYSAGGGTATAPAAAAATWASTTAYAAGALAVTSGRLYFATTAGTSGASAPTHTSGSATDGTVVWLFVGSGATAGAPANCTVNRLSGTGGTAAIAVQPRADGKNGNELALALIGSTDNTIFRVYEGTSSVSNSNFVAGDAFYAEQDVTFNGTGSNQYGNPDITMRLNAGPVQVFAALNAAGAQGDIQGNYTFRLRTPVVVVPAGGVTANNLWTLDGVKPSGVCLVTRKPMVWRDYNKSAPGAITW